MRVRDGEKRQHDLWDVPGVGHYGAKKFSSPCGLAALVDLPGYGKGAH
jgi:hypothetical protein